MHVNNRYVLILIIIMSSVSVAMEKETIIEPALGQDNAWRFLIDKALDKYNASAQRNNERQVNGQGENAILEKCDYTFDDINHITQVGLDWPSTDYPDGYATGQYIDINNKSGREIAAHTQAFLDSAPQVVVWRRSRSRGNRDGIKVGVNTRRIEQNYHERMPYFNRHPIKCMLMTAGLTGFIVWIVSKFTHRRSMSDQKAPK